MGIEPTTYSLGSCRSTTELRPRKSLFHRLFRVYAPKTCSTLFCQLPTKALRHRRFRQTCLSTYHGLNSHTRSGRAARVVTT
jgi:hypothetical protein